MEKVQKSLPNFLVSIIYIYAHNFSSGFLNPGRVAGGQAAALDHRSFACNYS